MKPGFALSLSDERIDLLQRTAEGWALVGSANPAGEDFDTALADLRDRALAESPEALLTKLILPADQILYADIDAPGPDRASRRAQIAKALEGRTPYRVEDLVFDWSGTGATVQVAVIARLTLDEAEAFAEAGGFAPVSFVAAPEPGRFAGEPYFGSTRRQAAHLPPGARLDRDQDPVPLDFARLPSAGEAELAEDSHPEVAPETQEAAVSDAVEDEDGWISYPPIAEADFIEVTDQDDEVLPDVERSELREDTQASSHSSFVSFRPAGRAVDVENLLDTMPARIRVGGSDPAPLPDDAAGPDDALPDAIDPHDGTPTADRDAAPTTDMIGPSPREPRLTAPDRSRNPALAPRPPSDARAARGRLLAVVGAAAAAFAALVLLWWLWFSVAGWAPLTAAAPEGQTPAAEPVATDRTPPEDQADAAPAVGAIDDQPPAPAVAESASVDVAATDTAAAEADMQATTEVTALGTPEPSGPGDQPPVPPAILALSGAQPTPDADSGRPLTAAEAPISATPPPGLGLITNADPLLPDPGLPTPFDGLVRFDPAGQIIPTSEGVRTPEGIILFAGLPPDNPGPRPAALAALEPEPVAPDSAVDSEPEAVLPPPDPKTAGMAPIARPASVVPVDPAPADATPLDPAPLSEEGPLTDPADAPTPSDATQPDGDQAQAAPPPDPATQGLAPRARPAALAAAELPEAEAPVAIATSSRYAIVTTRRPTARPDGTSRAVEAALAAALAEPEPAAAPATTATASADEVDEPEPESAAPDIPTKANVAREATVKNGIDLGDLSLIGITGSPAARLALVRTSSGKILRIKVGDNLDGGKVAAIGESELSYVKKGKTYVLKMTSKG